MAEQKQIRAIKGVRDILPPASTAWNRVEETARAVFATYGFGEIRVPIFEQTDLFARSVGGDTDIVSKEMYTFEDHELAEVAALRTLLVAKQPYIGDLNFFWSYEMKITEFTERLRKGLANDTIPKTPGNLRACNDLVPWLDTLAFDRQTYGNSGPSEEILARFNSAVGVVRGILMSVELGDEVSLRPEATASVCRAYIEHGMQTLPGNVKLYYIGPMFRRERPQKGRYRQFYQIGAEVLGQSDAPGIDAELIEMLVRFFDKAGLTGTTLYVNSIGCKECRPKYVELLREELRKVRDKLGADSQRRIETNPLRVLDSKIPEEQPVIETLPRIADRLCAACREHFAELEKQLAMRGIVYERNWRLVRGLDYYTRTTFEIIAPGLGSQNAVCGGGRYDGLVELLGGPPTKGIGFAIGTDRLMLSLEAAGKLAAERALDVFIVWMGAVAQAAAIQLAQRLRAAGIKVELPAAEMKLGKALQLGDKLGARYGLILGENEVAAGRYTLKRLADAVQRSLTEAELLVELRSER
ncbi:MAG TPA: histidine--tRNA ligase [Candidatus Acidoferrales bacterium]|nr:histidine--tRNA ligase [Candidatus Acidoferrales bacterium]